MKRLENSVILRLSIGLCLLGGFCLMGCSSDTTPVAPGTFAPKQENLSFGDANPTGGGGAAGPTVGRGDE
jgi:hypothetical protein